MAKAKTKSAAAPAAQSREEVEQLVGRIGEIQRELVRREADLGDHLAKVKEAAETKATPLKSELVDAQEMIQGWCEANRAAITRGGKTKTVELTTGKVLWRTRPPSVKIRKVEEVIAWLRERKTFAHFLRTKYEVDREALLADRAVAVVIPGVSIGSEGEDFVIEPFDAELTEASS